MKITVFKRDFSPITLEESSLDNIFVHIYPKVCPLSSLITPSEENWIPIEDLNSSFWGDISFRDVISQKDIDISQNGYVRVIFQIRKEGDVYYLRSNDFDSIKFELGKLKTSKLSISSDDNSDLLNIVSGGLPNLYFTIAETIYGCIHRVKCFLEEVVAAIIDSNYGNNDQIKEFLYNYYSIQKLYFDREKKWKWDKNYKDDNYWELHERAKKIKLWHDSSPNEKGLVEFSLLEKYHESFVAKAFHDFKREEKKYIDAASEFNDKNKPKKETNAEFQFVFLDNNGANSKIMNAWYLSNEGWNIEFSNFCDFVNLKKDAINEMCGNIKNEGEDPYKTIINYCKVIQRYRNRTSHNIKAQAEESESSYNKLFLNLVSLVRDLSISNIVNGKYLIEILEQKSKDVNSLITKRDQWQKTHY